jgi:hypothetical protein
MIGGLVIGGDAPKRVIVRAVGPSLAAAGVSGALGDPALDLRDATGARLAQNDNWAETQAAELMASGLAPALPNESAMAQTLPPGGYTALMTAQDGGSGVGLLEVYDADANPASRLMNISGRGFVGSGDNVLIGGFVVRGTGAAKVIVRGLGPSLANFGIAQPLADPTLEIRDGNGTLMLANGDWRESQQDEILATSLAPAEDAEAAAIIGVAPGSYTAILRGNGDTSGVGLLEIFKLQ